MTLMILSRAWNFYRRLFINLTPLIPLSFIRRGGRKRKEGASAPLKLHFLCPERSLKFENQNRETLLFLLRQVREV
jgi:hypothetical protein